MKTVLEILDEVNVRFKDLDVDTRRKLINAVRYYDPKARFTPAYKLGRWDGYVSYCDIGGRTYFNLLDELLPIVQDAGYEIEISDKRLPYQTFTFDLVNENSFSHIKWPKGHPMEGEPIILRDYQVDIINGCLENIQSVYIAPTASGKTIVTAALSSLAEKYGRTIVIVPTKDLVVQTEEDYKNMQLDVGVYYGDRKELGHTHTICTWQSIESAAKRKDGTIDSIIDDLICVIVDEVHKSSAPVLKKLLAGPFANVPIRWGLTGTMPEHDHEKVAVKAVIGKPVGQLKASKLQEEGYLANLHIHIKQLVDIDGFPTYHDELKWLTTNPKRLEKISEMIKEMVDKTGNTLVLVDRIHTGEALQESIPNSVFIKGSVKSADRKKEFDEIQKSDKKVIIATAQLASTGINIPRIFNLVLIEPGKSFVRVIQSIGRGLRKAKDKTHVDVYDITSTCKYARRHLSKRKKFYKDAEYPFTQEKVEYL